MVNRNEWQKQYRQKNNNKCTKQYEKTKAGFLMRTYRNMYSRITGIQKKKLHLYKDLALLDKQEFYSWSLNDAVFNALFDAWEELGYPRKYTPSIDRVDTTKGYELGNIQWITHSENSSKGAKARWQKL